MSLQSVRGTHDLLFEECARHRHIFQVAREASALFGFKEIATPIFEFSEVFQRSLGGASDIVSKEMYTFLDKGGDSITLRPEGTAGVARAFISKGLTHLTPFKAFYHGPMFRYERPQKGRQRQFHQCGVELLGVSHPLADLECLGVADLFLQKLGVRERSTLEINSLGDQTSRQLFEEKLISYLHRYVSELSEDSQRRLKTNPLRILDSKDPQDHKILEGAPQLQDCWSEESKQVFSAVCAGLTTLGIQFRHNSSLVRGLDYYSHVVFEYKTTELGAQDAILSGGRYDGLIEQLGGPPTPGCGWAAGLERLALMLQTQMKSPRPLAIIPLGGSQGELESLKIAQDLRRHGFYVEITFSGNLSKRMKKAAGLQAQWAILVGGDEGAQGFVTLKDMDRGVQTQIRPQELVQKLSLSDSQS